MTRFPCQDLAPQVSRVQNAITITVVDADLNDNPFTVQSNLGGRLYAYRDMYLCSPSQFPHCNQSIMADGSSYYFCSSADSTTCTGGAVQELRLTETNYNSSQFTSVLDTTSFSTPSLYRFSYKGPVNHAGGGLAEAYVRMIDQPNVSAFGADRDVQFFSAGENISITVFDASANTDSCISDVVLVNIKVLNQVDVENVSLLETSHDSSLFTGTISTRIAGLADVVKYNNIVTLTSYSDVLVVSYPSAAQVTSKPNFPSSSSNTRRPPLYIP